MLHTDTFSALDNEAHKIKRMPPFHLRERIRLHDNHVISKGSSYFTNSFKRLLGGIIGLATLLRLMKK